MQYIALIFGKISIFLLKLFGKKGGSFPGKYALKICPEILKAFKYPDKIILITGTNGKTSITNMTAKILENAGFDVISNSNGDNIINGIVTCCLRGADLGFKIRKGALVLEVDELTLAKNLKYFPKATVCVNNLFRDQLDRVGEEDYIYKKIFEALRDFKGKLILNGDDPQVNSLSLACKDAESLNFGMKKGVFSESADIPGKVLCPVCKKPLAYDEVYYSHMGSYHCECGYSNEKLNIVLTQCDKAAGDFTVDAKTYSAYPVLTYHIYNALAAVAIAKAHGIEHSAVYETIKNFKLGMGRMEIVNISGRSVLLNLVKNLAGINETIKKIASEDGEKTILFVLNDYIADGRDISWIWDADFEEIKGLKNVVTSGRRPYEAALRFKYILDTADIEPEADISRAVDRLISNDTKLYALATYTGMSLLRAETKKRGEMTK